MEYAHDYRPLASISASNPELQWLHQLLGRENSKSAASDQLSSSLAIPEDSLASALDPVQSADELVYPSDDGEESDGLEFDDEVKIALTKLDTVDHLLASYSPQISVSPSLPVETSTEEPEDSLNSDGEVPAATDSDSPSADAAAPRRSSRLRRSTRRHTPSDAAPASTSPSVAENAFQRAFESAVEKASRQIYGRAGKALSITETNLRSNRSLLLGCQTVRYFDGLGAVRGEFVSYDADTDLYTLQFKASNFVEYLDFDDVVQLLPIEQSESKQRIEANRAQIRAGLAKAFHAVCFQSHGKPIRGHPLATAGFTEPATFRHVSSAPDADKWEAAMLLEIETLMQMGCFEIIDLSDMPQDSQLVGCRWVYKLKFKDGQYDKHRARLVALGYQQQYGRDFWEVFSPTCNQTSIRLILALTAVPGWRSLDLDAQCAFISAVLPPTERVYLAVPPGFEWYFGKNKALICRHTLYGLCQSPRAYYLLCKEVYAAAGLRQLKSDECVFVRLENNIKGAQASLSSEDVLKHGYFQTMKNVPPKDRIYPSCPHPVAALIIAMYVDNNAVRHNCDELVEQFEQFVKADGRIRMLREGEMQWLLGVRYWFNLTTGEISCNQSSSIESLLKKYGMENCNPSALPMSPGTDLASIPVADKPDKDVIGVYASLVGELLYIAINTVPQIAFPLSCLTRYMINATVTHLKYAKGVLRYLAGVKDRRITWGGLNVRQPHELNEIWACADASYADVKPCRKSSLMYLLFVNNATFSWKATLSTIVATSSCEAELYAYCACAAEVVWARKLADELGFAQLKPTKIYEDNAGCIALAENMHLRNRSKHIALRFSFVQHLFELGIIKPMKCSTAQQLADPGTKNVSPAIFNKHIPYWLGEITS